MAGQVDDRIKTQRSNILIELGNKMHKDFLKKFINKKIEILIEEKIIVNNKEYYTGYTKEYVKVIIETNDLEDMNNTIITVVGKKTMVDIRTNEEILLAEI